MQPTSNVAPRLRESLRFDLPAGLVVFLVALPLCLGIALASGAPLIAGLIAGMVGGLVVPLISRAELSVCGPAAGLAAVVLAGLTALGSFEAFAVAVVLAGVLQIAMGALRLGRLSGFFPTGVVGGMLAAIGVLLIMKQVPHAIGLDREAFAAENATPFPSLSALGAAFNPVAVAVAASAMAALLGWDRWAKKRGGSNIPSPLVAVVVGVAVHELVRSLAPAYALAPEHLVTIPEAAAWKGSLRVPDPSTFLRLDVWGVAVTLAIVASIESLLNVEAIDRLDPFTRRAPMNRELVAQGVGNIVSGLLGGLPITSVVIRSTTALQAGARTRGAALIHGALILATVVALGPILEHIPLSCLAAILLVTGYKLASPLVLRAAWKAGREHFVPFAATLIGVVALDLLKGVAIGVLVALAIEVRRSLGRAVEVVQEEGRTLIRLVRDVPFFARAELQAALDAIPPKTRVVVDAEQATSIHRDVREAVRAFLSSASRRSVEVEVRGLPT